MISIYETIIKRVSKNLDQTKREDAEAEDVPELTEEEFVALLDERGIDG